MKYRLLRIDLAKKTYGIEKIPSEVIANYLGGKGFAAYYLFREVKPKVNPLSADNKLMYFLGPLTGLFPGTDRYVVAAKSPLSCTFSDSYAGGWFGSELRKAGYMGLIFEGKANDLVYLEIEGDKISIKDARQLRGKSPEEVDRALPGFRVAAIGLAGENLVKYAVIISNASKQGRAGVAGRGGLGAVMGSKNLKAIAIKAGQRNKEYLELYEKTKELRKNNNRYLRENIVPEMGIGGNLPLVDLSSQVKVLPTRNFTRGTIDEYTEINEETIKKIKVKKDTCYLCPAACGVRVNVKTGPYAGVELDRIEYETVAMCGPNCGHNALGSIVNFNRLCNEYGIDTISTGNIIAFVMECAEKGLVDYKIKFGDAEGQTKLIESTSKREGIGDLLAEGVARVSEELGKATESFAMHVKGLELPGYDPRGSIGMALCYATADRGGCHMRAWSIGVEAFGGLDPFSSKGKAGVVKNLQDTSSAMWTLITCDNLLFSIEQGVEMLKSVGFNMDQQKMLEVGERIYNLTRLFNVRESFTRKDDCIPQRLYETREDTQWKITREDFEKMLDEYYKLRNWDKNGKPSDEILKKLGIER